jgi:hypothetical protein
MISILLIVTYLLTVTITPILIYPNHEVSKSLSTILSIPALIFASTLLQRTANIAIFEIIFRIILATQIISIPLHFFGLFSDTALEKASILFNEPSHFAITITPLAIISIIESKRHFYRIAYLTALSIVALYFKNLVLLVSISVCAIVAISMIRKASTKLIASAFIVSILAMISQTQSDYIIARLDLGSQDNASVLTLLSAYERLYLTLKNETIFGVGIQGFSTNSPTGLFFSTLYQVDGRVSLSDGGVTFAKFGSELGVFSIPVFFIAVYATIKTFLSSNISAKQRAIFLAFSVGFFIEFFLRGVGYYSINLITYASLIIISITSTGKTSAPKKPSTRNLSERTVNP